MYLSLADATKLGGPTGNRTPTRGLQSHCAPVITISPNLSLVPPERFELPTPAFVAQCSIPNELRRHIVVVPRDRIELPTSDYKTDVIPLN